jgi:hypothetical protein
MPWSCSERPGGRTWHKLVDLAFDCTCTMGPTTKNGPPDFLQQAVFNSPRSPYVLGTHSVYRVPVPAATRPTA